MNRIPKRFQVGGQDIEVQSVDICENSCVGDCWLAQGVIQIADYAARGVKQSETSKQNTFYHELTHAILRTMGESDLNANEKFVCTFSGFLTEAIRSFEYGE